MVDYGFLLGKLAPEMVEVVQRRYNILRAIAYLQPVGRRVLAEKLGLQERAVRNDVELLKEQELILAEVKGMTITPLGEKILKELSNILHSFRGLGNIERDLASFLGLERVIIVPGDFEHDPLAKRELGRVAALHLNEVIKKVKTIAIAGGTTLAELANHIIPQNRQDLLVLPARGGLGEQVEIQANTIAAKIAKNLGASYRLLHAPDYMSQKSAEQLAQDPYIAPTIQLIRETEVLIHGIGNVYEMAKRRGMGKEEIEKLISLGAKGEAFGYYFDQQGSAVYSTPSIGLKLVDLGKIKKIIAIAGGRSKAEAIKAVTKAGFIHWLIIDEGAAEEIING